MIRVVRSPDGVTSVNASGKSPGRGAYVCRNIACVRLAKKKNAFTRALKAPVEPDIYDQLEEICLDGDG